MTLRKYRPYGPPAVSLTRFDFFSPGKPWIIAYVPQPMTIEQFLGGVRWSVRMVGVTTRVDRLLTGSVRTGA